MNARHTRTTETSPVHTRKTSHGRNLGISLLQSSGQRRRFIRNKLGHTTDHSKIGSFCVSPAQLSSFHSRAVSPNDESQLTRAKPLAERKKTNEALKTSSPPKAEDSRSCGYTQILEISRLLPEKSVGVYELLHTKDKQIEALTKEVVTLKLENSNSESKAIALCKQIDSYKGLVDFCTNQFGILDGEVLSNSYELDSLVSAEKIKAMMIANSQLDLWRAKAEAAQLEKDHMRQQVFRLTEELASQDRSSRLVETMSKQLRDLNEQLFEFSCEVQLLRTENERLKVAYGKEATANKTYVCWIKQLSLQLADSRRAVISNDLISREEQMRLLITSLESTLELEELQGIAQLDRFVSAITTIAEENRLLRQELEALKPTIVA